MLPLEEKYSGLSIASLESATTAIRFSDRNSGLVVVSLSGNQQAKTVAFRTTDGGATWNDELAADGAGSLYLSPDGRYVTSYFNSVISVYRYDME